LKARVDKKIPWPERPDGLGKEIIGERGGMGCENGITPCAKKRRLIGQGFRQSRQNTIKGRKGDCCPNTLKVRKKRDRGINTAAEKDSKVGEGGTDVVKGKRRGGKDAQHSRGTSDTRLSVRRKTLLGAYKVLRRKKPLKREKPGMPLRRLPLGRKGPHSKLPQKIEIVKQWWVVRPNIVLFRAKVGKPGNLL